MENRFIIIIWHQAGQRNNSAIYYTLDDAETGLALVFDSEDEAKDYWNTHKINHIHAGFIVNAAVAAQNWI